MSFPNLAGLRLKSILMKRKRAEHGENPIEELLKPISVLEPEDSEDETDVNNDIPDVFEEFHKNTYLKRQPNNRYLSKHEADVKTMADFTDDFKKTMAKVRNDLQIGKELLLETADDIQKIFESPRDTKIFPKLRINKDILELLDDSTITIPTPSELKEMRKASDVSSLSVLWHLLAVNSDKNKFRVSSPAFDTFKQEEPHWLQRVSVSWNDIGKATPQCERWMKHV